MGTLATLPKRHPNVPLRRVPLSLQDHEVQVQRGLYTVQRGERLAIPADCLATPCVYKYQTLWTLDREHGIHRPGVKWAPKEFAFQQRVLKWLRDNVNANIPHLYYLMTLGHDVHVTIRGDLWAKHWHYGWTNPFNPEQLELPLDPAAVQGYGFCENCGWLSGGKVSDAFVSEIVDELVSTSGTEFADFDSHEVGTSSQAENNNDTALIATSGIARAAGAPTDSDPIYQNVGTITADATETWEEHGLFNNTAGAALMDRSLTGGQSVNSSDQVQYTYQLTLNPEA